MNSGQNMGCTTFKESKWWYTIKILSNFEIDSDEEKQISRQTKPSQLAGKGKFNIVYWLNFFGRLE